MNTQAVQQSDGGMTEVEWEGILHWKTWVLAGLDCCISTIKCAQHRKICPANDSQGKKWKLG